MKLTQEEFESTVFMRECVVEIPSLVANEISFNGGTLLISGGNQENENAQAVRYGKLVKLPKKTGLMHGDMFSCKLDAEVGDMVYWDQFWSAQELQRKKGEKGTEDFLIEVEDKLYLRIPSVSLSCAKRGDEFVALNGYIIAQQIEEEDIKTESGLWIPAQKKPTARARVVAVPKSIPEFRDKEFFKYTRVEVGDVVRTEPFYQIKLDRSYSSRTDLVRILSAVIMAIE